MDISTSRWTDSVGRDSPERRHVIRSVFISHASEDTEIAFNVAAMLKRYLDLDSHVDRGFLRSGVDWTAEIKRKMRESEVVLVLLSRVVAGELAAGVREEVELAQSLNIPILFGTIRGYSARMEFQFVDFGEDGRRVEGVWELAKFLISESHHFRVLGIESFYVDASRINLLFGSPEKIASLASDVFILGHTMKQWLGDYGNAIRHCRASVTMYFPARNAVGLELLSNTHRSGDRILQQIERAKHEALALERELNDSSRFQCFAIPVKPMFSTTVVDPTRHDAYMIIDHYSFKVGAEDRPKFVVRGSETPMFKYYWKVFEELVEHAAPLESDVE
jgi:hypothetical protein